MLPKSYHNEYIKYKQKYLIIKYGGTISANQTIYISATLTNIANTIINGVSANYTVNILNGPPKSQYMYITNTCADFNKMQNEFKFKKIILIALTEAIGKLEFCSIACQDAAEVVDYITIPDLELGLKYLVDGNSGMRKIELHKKLRSWDIVYDKINTNVDYIRQEPDQTGRYNKEIYGIHCILRNLVDASTIGIITDKEQLYYEMKKTHDDYLDYMPEMRKLGDVDKVTGDEVLIVRPVGPGAHSGNGVLIVASDGDLLRAKKEALKKPKWKWIISRYIKNPLLFMNTKFHFRCYLMVTTLGIFHRHPTYEIITAKNQYIASDYANHDIHDSHGMTTPKFYTYPADIMDPRIASGVNKIMDRVEALFGLGQIRGYSETKYAYEILGLDILFDAEYNPWLLEVNSKIGHGVNEYDPKYQQFEKEFLTWEYNSIVGPTFSKITFTPMSEMTPTQINELLVLSQDKQIMDNIGIKKIWDHAKIQTMINDSKLDASTNTKPRQYYNWVACLKYGTHKVIGFASLRPMINKIDKIVTTLNISPNDLQIRVFTYPGKGFGTRIVKKVERFVTKEKIRTWAVIHCDNAPSIAFFKKLKWIYKGDIMLGDSKNAVFLFDNTQ